MTPNSLQANSDPLGFGNLAELRRIELRAKRRINTDLIGNFRSSFRGSGLTFSDLRPYSPGDEIKHIHWRATARTSTVYVKSYDEERSLRIILALDISASTNFGGQKTMHKKAIEFSALVSTLARVSGDAVGLALFSEAVDKYLPCGRKRSHYDELVMSLLQAKPQSKASNLTVALEHIRRHERRQAVLFIISDFFVPPFEQELKHISLRHDVICVKLGSYENIPTVGIVEFADAETGEMVMIDTGSKKVQRFLKERALAHHAELRELCSRCGTDLIEIVDDPLRPLAALMQARSRRLR